jgi:hypothetical protein
MDFFVTTSQAQHSYRVLRNKEELFAELSKMIDKAVDNGCTYFDLIVNTDVECKVEKESSHA